jgi:predicted metal-dependent phosphoesterase TrpH
MESTSTSRPGRADLHMHTTASDGRATVQQLLDYVAKRGTLDVIAITDHDVLDASLWAYARRDRYPFEIVPGVEVSSAAGHILALWVTEPVPRDLSLNETVAAIHERGGLAVLAHPFHVGMGLVARNASAYLRNPQLLVDSGLDGIEVHNAAVLTVGSNMVARRVTRKAGLSPLGNSDAHTLGAIGSGRTRFPGHTAADLRAAITQKKTAAEGRPWPLVDYVSFTRHMIGRRGQSHPNAARS